MIVFLLPKWLRRENSYVKDSESSSAEGDHWDELWGEPSNKRLLQSRKASGSRASLAIDVLVAQLNREMVG
jgi:hypothetical protein